MYWPSKPMNTNSKSEMIAVSCSVRDIVLKGGGLRLAGASLASGGTEILHARGALVGGRRLARGLHDEGGGPAVAFLTSAGSALEGRSASRVCRPGELLSVG